MAGQRGVRESRTSDVGGRKRIVTTEVRLVEMNSTGSVDVAQSRSRAVRGGIGEAYPDGRQLGPARHEPPLSRQTAVAIAGALAEAGTQLLFGVPGGGPNLDVIGAAADVGIRFVLTHGETAAAIMAATYAELTGVPGAMVATRGPGLASAANGIAHALLDRLPVVAIVDTVSVKDRDRIGHQRIDQDAFGKSISKAAVTLGVAHCTAGAARAVEIACALPRGPVVLNFDPAAEGLSPGTPGTARTGSAVQDLTALREALSLARRPLVMLGLGALDHASAIRNALVGSRLPVLHTYRARGIVPDSCAEAAGLVTGGTMESPLLGSADLVVGLGVDPVELIPAPWEHAAPVVLVSEVPTEARAYFSADTEIVAPLPAAAEQLRERAAAHDWPAGAGRAAKRATVALLRQGPAPVEGRLAPQEVVATVRSLTPPATIATVDAGAHMLVVMPLWPVEEPHRLLISSGLATMGYALPAAISAALCRPEHPVVAFTGDGGLGMTVMELETAVRHRLHVIVVVFNDSTLSLIKIKQEAGGQGGEEAVCYGEADFASIATAMGAASERVSDVARLTSAVDAALRREGPTLIDVQTDPSDYPMVLDLTRGQAGRISSRQ